MRNTIYTLFLFFICFGLNGQDIHFTQFSLSPLTLNPALTGSFEGTFRVGGIFRDQYSSVSPGAFRTPSGYVDAPLIKGFRDQDWIGVGVMFFSDQSGSGRLKYSAAMLSGSYHIGLDKDQTRVFSIGIQGGQGKRRLDHMDGQQTRLRFPDGIANGTPTISEDLGRLNDNKSFTDFSVGLLYRGLINDGADMQVGLSVAHINQPKYGLLGQEKFPMRITGHAGFNFLMGEKLLFSPAALVQKVGNATELAVQGQFGLIFNEEKHIILNIGPGYRVLDAMEILVGLDYGDFRFGVGYDVNISKLTPASGSVGGIEVAAAYVARIYKKPKVDNILFCPRF